MNKGIPPEEITKDMDRDEPLYLDIIKRGDGRYKEISFKSNAYEIYVKQLHEERDDEK